jgi:hypothetical protein
MFLLSLLEPDTSRLLSSLYMFVLGAGIGMVMQTLILAAQNAVELRDMGVVSSATTFFRSMGGSFGVAIFGAIFSSRLAVELPARIPSEFLRNTEVGALLNSPQHIRSLPGPVRDGITEAVAASIHSVFLWAIPLLLVGWVLSWLLPERPLRSSIGPEAADDPDAELAQAEAVGAIG